MFGQILFRRLVLDNPPLANALNSSMQSASPVFMIVSDTLLYNNHGKIMEI
jgi:hypothetical protein